MRNNLTELVFILDRSGSMAGLQNDTIGGYNAMLDRQRSEPGRALVSTVLFDDRYELLHDRLPLDRVPPITSRDYFARGTTALLDAIGRTVLFIDSAHERMAPEVRPAKTLFVITTDGQENASTEFNLQRIRALIEKKKSRYGWKFLFLGANIDAVDTAQSFGISAAHAVDCFADSLGSRAQYEAIGEAVSAVRADAPLTGDWKRGIERDALRRGGR